ncbi:MAG: hypothetical protein WBA18_20390 [Terracidiphilus sp.]
MEIGPIPGIRALGAVSAQRRVLDPPAVFDIDGSAKPGDGAVQRASMKAEGAEEEEDDDLPLEEEPGEEKNVDYFA